MHTDPAARCACCGNACAGPGIAQRTISGVTERHLEEHGRGRQDHGCAVRFELGELVARLWSETNTVLEIRPSRHQLGCGLGVHQVAQSGTNWNTPGSPPAGTGRGDDD